MTISCFVTLEVLVSTGRCFVSRAVVSLLETRTSASSKIASDFADAEQGQAGIVFERCPPYFICSVQASENDCKAATCLTQF